MSCTIARVIGAVLCSRMNVQLSRQEINLSLSDLSSSRLALGYMQKENAAIPMKMTKTWMLVSISCISFARPGRLALGLPPGVDSTYIGSMAYATITDLETTYSVSLFLRLCVRADDPSPVDPTLVAARKTAALEEASGFMDSYFQVCYNVPVQTTIDSALATLRNCCCVLAVASLVRQKGYVRGSEDESLIIAQDSWRSWLRDVSKGSSQVPGASATDASLAPGGSAPRQSFFVASERREVRGLNRRFV